MIRVVEQPLVLMKMVIEQQLPPPNPTVERSGPRNGDMAVLAISARHDIGLTLRATKSFS